MRERIAIVTDSACDLAPSIIDRYGIHVLPLKIIYDDKDYRDREDIQPEDVYRLMPEKIPTTSTPSLGEIKELLQKAVREGADRILAIHLSSHLSGTLNSVMMAARELKDIKVEVFDSRNLSMGLGFQVYRAAMDAAKGFSLTDIMANLQRTRDKVKVFYVLETLEYLKRGGRIGRVAAVLGEFLHLKPIISVDEEGKYYVHEKARGRKKSIDKLAEIVERIAEKTTINLAVMHGGAQEEARKLKEGLERLPNLKEVFFGQISPALGIHTGPGLIGVAFHEVE